MVRAPCADMYASRSCFVIRPPAPVPFTCRRSMLYSRAILRTSGDNGPAGRSVSATVTGSGSLTGTGYGPADAATGWRGVDGSGVFAATEGPTSLFLAASCFCGSAWAGRCGAAAGAGVDAAAPLSSILPTTVLIATVLPSSTNTCDNTPAAGDGISVSTLSVEISNKGSSRSTCSPGFFSHFVSVPSTILSPIWGITTSIMKLSPLLRWPLPHGRGSIALGAAGNPAQTGVRSDELALRSHPRGSPSSQAP